ncbi:flavin monoamine oxidase family protein [Nocardia tengchongensis]|uniref:flavin monoamine oxidase family protein n=1 Tax=Nocardia tengchongensis TaxID=2055889 RepID=UPI0036C0055D
MEKTYDVVVVGAGLAGLTAAYELREQDVLVLEAADKLSSRSRHEEFAGYRITVGGEDWADPDPNSYVRSIITELGVPTSNVHGSGAVIWKDELIWATSVEELVAQLPLSAEAKPSFVATFERIGQTVNALYSEGGNDLARELLKVTATEWLGDIHPEVLHYYRRLYASEFTVAPEQVSALYFVAYMVPYGGAGFDAWAEYRSPEGGMADVVEALAAKLPSAPLTGAHVTRITREGDDEVVTYLDSEGEHTVRARHVVVATPAAVAAQVVTDLPAWKADALGAVRSETALEMHVLVDDGGSMPWDDLLCAWTIDSVFGLLLPSQTDRSVRIVAAGTENKKSIIKLLSLGGPSAPFMDRTDEQIAAAFLHDFYRVFPEAQGRVTQYRIDRWSWGATYPRFGYEDAVLALTSPVRNVHFAGDWSGFARSDADGAFSPTDYSAMIGVHVAMGSGVRAAREIVDSQRQTN